MNRAEGRTIGKKKAGSFATARYGPFFAGPNGDGALRVGPVRPESGVVEDSATALQNLAAI
jgi:hypothetical protein